MLMPAKQRKQFTNIYVSVSFKVSIVYNEWGYYNTIPTQTSLIFKPWLWLWCLPFPQCVSHFHSLAEIMGGFKIHGHMTIKMYSCQDAGGGSTYPLAQLTPLSPTSIEDETEAGSESEGAPTLIKTSTIKSLLQSVPSSLLIVYL